MKFLLALLLILTISYLTSFFAFKRGRDRMAWFILGFLFGFFALITVLILPPLNSKKEKQEPLTKDLQQEDLKLEVALENSESLTEHKWHLIDVNGRQKGPVDALDLRLAWDDGLIKENTYVWCDGMDEWKQISELEDLKSYLKS